MTPTSLKLLLGFSYVTALGVILAAHASADDDISVPEGYPLIDAPELRITKFEQADLPPLFDGAFLYVNDKEADIPAGRLEFTVKRDGVIFLLATWEYDGNSSGDWKPEALTREELAQTWIDLGAAPWDEKQILFARQCKAGESFKIRNRKYNPAQPILVPAAQVAGLDGASSPLAKALVAGLGKGPSSPAPFPTPSSPKAPPESQQLDVKAMKLASLEQDKLPKLFEGALIYVNEKEADVPAGRLEFTAKQDGLVLLLASWEYDGNPGDGWKPEAVTREQLGTTWADLGKAPWDENQVLFARQCKAGETFQIRTRKYNPPQPILLSKTALADADSSQFAKTLMARLKQPAAPSPAAESPLMASVPDGYPVLEVEGLSPAPLEVENLPAYLKGAMIYARDVSEARGDVSKGELKFNVLRGGRVFLNVTWKYDGNFSGDWTETALNYFQLTSDWESLGRCPWDPDYWLVVRDCEAGEEFALRTRKYHAPQLIITPPVDLLSAEFAEIVPIQLQEGEVKRQIRQLLAEKKYDELERMATEFREPASMFPSSHSPLAALYNTLSEVVVGDNRHYTQKIKELEAWVDAAPESLTARVALARTLINHGFFARGEGWAGDVSERQSEVFQQQLNRGELVLLQVGVDAPKDAGYYAERVHAAIGLGATRDEVIRWTVEGAKLSPWSASAIYDAANFFLPRWHGERGDLVKLAEALVEATREDCGDALYARVVLGVSNLVDLQTFSEDDFSWERTRQGLIDLRNRFPKSRELLNAQCSLATLAFDRELAAACFDEIGDNPRIETWGSVEHYETQRQAFSKETWQGDQDRIWLAHASGTKYACFSPGGAYVLTSGHDSLVKIWEVDSGREIRRQSLVGRFNVIDYLDDDTVVIGDTEGRVTFWDWDKNETRTLGPMRERVISLDCSADSRYLFAADYFGNSFIIDLETNQSVHRGEQEHGYYNLGTFSADSRFLASTGSDGRIVIHNLSVGRPESQFDDDKSHKDAIAMSPDGTRVATGDESGFVKVWQIDGWKLIASTVEKGDRVRGLAFSPDGKYLAIARGGGFFFESGGLWLLSVDDRAIERRVAGHSTCVYDVDFSPDGKLLLSVGEDWTLRLYETAQLVEQNR